MGKVLWVSILCCAGLCTILVSWPRQDILGAFRPIHAANLVATTAAADARTAPAEVATQIAPTKAAAQAAAPAQVASAVSASPAVPDAGTTKVAAKDLWPQWSSNFRKCSKEEVEVESRADCQSRAVDVGVQFYQWEATQLLCGISAECKRPLQKTEWDWRVYKAPEKLPPADALASQVVVEHSLEQGASEARVAIATMVTVLNPEHHRLFRSIALFEPTATIWVSSTTEAERKIRSIFPMLRIKTAVALDRFQGHSRAQLTSKNMWLPLQMEKASILRTALEAEGVAKGAWYLDPDMFLLAPLPRLDAQLGLSHHRIHPEQEAMFGKWNGGCIFVRSLDVLNYWEKAAPKARSGCCQDQTSLEDVARKFKSTLQEVGCGTDVGWFRFTDRTTKQAASHSRIQCVAGKVMYEGCQEEIRSFHYHVSDKDGSPMRPHVEKALRDCKHPVLPIVLNSYPDPPKHFLGGIRRLGG